MDSRNYGVVSIRSLCHFMMAEPPFADHPMESIKVGNTKVFLMPQAFHNLELNRSDKLCQADIHMQKLWRSHVAERAFIITYCCILMLQSNSRRLLAQKLVENMRNANHWQAESSGTQNSSSTWRLARFGC